MIIRGAKANEHAANRTGSDALRSGAGRSPRFQKYSVPCEEDWAILDALNYVKDNIDTTLAYRWSCHMMVCGSCGMMVNGEPSLTCKTFVRDLPDQVRIEPLENFPIERDLVVVLDDVMEKLQMAKPYIIRKRPAARRHRIHPVPRRPVQVQAVHHVRQLHVLLCGLPPVRPGFVFHRPGRTGTGPPLQPRLA